MNPKDIPLNEKLLYLMYHTEFDIECLIYNVLEDSETDTHYSAVTAANMIYCYIDVMESLDKSVGYNDHIGFLDAMMLTDEEKDLFESKRKKELEYYVGDIIGQ